MKDLIEIGNVFVLGASGSDAGVDISMKRCAAYIARLAVVPPSVVAKLSMSDFMRCQEVILDFFREIGYRTEPADAERLAFDVAWFWRLPRDGDGARCHTASFIR